MISLPNKNDVLLGRGPIYSEHPGNLQFRVLVQEQKQKYLQVKKKKEKRDIAQGIIENISCMDPPGRFLKMGWDEEGGSDCWVVVDADTAMEKVLHRLREKEKTRKNDNVGDSSNASTPSLDVQGEKNVLVVETCSPGVSNGDHVANGFARSQTIPRDTSNSSTPESSTGAAKSINSKSPVDLDLPSNSTTHNSSVSHPHVMVQPAQFLSQNEKNHEVQQMNEMSVMGAKPIPIASYDSEKGIDELASNPTLLELLMTNLGEDDFSFGGDASDELDFASSTENSLTEQDSSLIDGSKISFQHDTESGVLQQSERPAEFTESDSCSEPLANKVSMKLDIWLGMAAQWLTSSADSSSLSSSPVRFRGSNPKYTQIFLPNAVRIAQKLAKIFLNATKSRSPCGFHGKCTEERLDPINMLPLDSKSILLDFTESREPVIENMEFFDQGLVLDSVRVTPRDERQSIDATELHEINQKYDEIDSAIIRNFCCIFCELFTLGNITTILDLKPEKYDDSTQNHSQRMLNVEDAYSYSDHAVTDYDRKTRRLDFLDETSKLRIHGVPLPLCRLVADMKLLSEGNRSSALTLEDIFADLSQMMADPDRFLYDAEHVSISVDNPDDSSSRPFISPKVRVNGREKELSTLIQTSEKLSENHGSSIVWISGVSGVGKSSLVKQFKDYLAQTHSDSRIPSRDGGEWKTSATYYSPVPILSCKFDLMKQAKPFGAIASALDDYFSGLWNQASNAATANEEVSMFLSDVIRVLEETLGRSVVTLCEMIPSFDTIYSNYFSNCCSSTTSREALSVVGVGGSAKARIHFIFCKLLHTISVHSIGPLLLILDDCHWADMSTLELLRDLCFEFNDSVSSDVSNGILVIGCYRSNEVDKSHPLMNCMSEMGRNPATYISSIHLENFNRKELRALVSDALALPTRIVQSLSDVLFVKTLGNPFFLTQYIESLAREGLLYFSLNEKRWFWILSKISAKKMDDSIAMHFAREIHNLSGRLRTALKIVSCFGCTIGLNVLDLLSNGGVEDMEMTLEEAVVKGFMMKDGKHYTFSHDAIQQAAYFLIPRKKRSQYHKILGQRLIARTSSTETMGNSSVFLIVDQINRVDIECLSEQERDTYSTLNFDAAKNALELFNFGSALQYINAGVALLGNSHWKTQYSLSLRLFQAGAYTCYVESRLDEMHVFLDGVFASATSIIDKVEAYIVLILSLYSESDLTKALRCVLDVLVQLEEHFPENVDSDMIKSCFAKAPPLLDKIGKDRFDTLLVMTDITTIVVMRLLKLALNISFRMSSKLGILFAFRMIELTHENGIAKESSFGIISFACNFMYITLNVEQGYRIGKLAISLLDNPISDGERGPVGMSFYARLAPPIDPIQSISEPLLKSYNDNILTGNIELAAVSAHAYCAYRFVGGVELGCLSKDYVHFISEMARYNQKASMRILLATYHGLVTFVDIPSNPLDSLLGEEFGPEKLLEYAENSGDKQLLSYILNNDIRVSSWNGDLDRTEKALVRLEEERAKLTVSDVDPFVSFIFGTCMFRLFRKTGNSKWYSDGLKHIENLEKWQCISKWHWENKKYLLEAERHFTDGNIDQATCSYQLSVDAAQRSRFIHLEGYAFELWASMCFDIGDTEGYLAKLREAHRCYICWGGTLKANKIAHQIQEYELFLHSS